MAAVSWLSLALLVCAVAVVIGAEWPRLGERLGVNGTPTFFVNGQKIEGALPIEEFRDAVRRALREAGVTPPR